MEYTERLAKQFGDLKISLVNFDNGNTPESMAAYILVEGLTPKMLKDKGSTALDLGNYIYRKYGIQYEMTPEYHRSQCPKNSIAFYISKQRMDKMPHLTAWVLKHDESKKRWQSVLYDKRKLAINAGE